MPLDRTVIATLLAHQGYQVPDDDLDEITLTVHRLVDQALAWDALEPFDHEPWAAWPSERGDG